MLSTAAPLSAINPSFPRSIPNIEPPMLEPRETELYPRIFSLFGLLPTQEYLMASTFGNPCIDDWLKVVNAGSESSDWDKINDLFNEGLHSPSINFIMKAITLKGNNQANALQNLVNFTVIAEKWMNGLPIRKKDKARLEGMENYFTMLTSLHDNADVQKYTALHEFIKKSLNACKKAREYVLNYLS
ncbi:hypothetical protein H0H93_009813 [Arthromyces matolae]|nr:hypothetical protein H0H93_009813 [Arthromyces matolae]